MSQRRRKKTEKRRKRKAKKALSKQERDRRVTQRFDDPVYRMSKDAMQKIGEVNDYAHVFDLAAQNEGYVEWDAGKSKYRMTIPGHMALAEQNIRLWIDREAVRHVPMGARDAFRRNLVKFNREELLLIAKRAFEEACTEYPVVNPSIDAQWVVTCFGMLLDRSEVKEHDDARVLHISQEAVDDFHKKRETGMSREESFHHAQKLLEDYTAYQTVLAEIEKTLGPLDDEKKAEVLTKTVEIGKLLDKKRDLDQQAEGVRDKLREFLFYAAAHLGDEKRKQLLEWVERCPNQELTRVIQQTHRDFADNGKAALALWAYFKERFGTVDEAVKIATEGSAWKGTGNGVTELFKHGLRLRTQDQEGDEFEWGEESKEAFFEHLKSLGYSGEDMDEQLNIQVRARHENVDMGDAFVPSVPAEDGSQQGALHVDKLNPDDWEFLVMPKDYKAPGTEPHLTHMSKVPNTGDLPRIPYDPDNPDAPETREALQEAAERAAEGQKSQFREIQPGVFASPQGYSADELQKKLPELIAGVQNAELLPGSGDYVPTDSVIGGVCINLASGPKPIYPYVELIYEQALPDLPQQLEVQFADDKAIIYDPQTPNRPLYVGSVDAKYATTFNTLRKMWGYWFLRLSIGEVNSNSNRRRKSRQSRVGLAPAMGQVYYDYQIANRRVYGLRMPIHQSIDQLERQCCTGSDPDQWVLNLAEAINEGGSYSDDEALQEAEKTRAILEKLVGRMPWRLADYRDKEQRKSHHRIVVDTFLEVCERVRQQTGDEDIPGMSPDMIRRQRMVWAWLRNAKPFEFSNTTYERLHHAADVYTTEQITGVEWQDSSVPISEREGFDPAEYVEQIIEAGKQVPFPEHLPFQVCYFAWGKGVNLGTTPTLLASVEHDVGEPIREAILYAHLVTDTGYVLSFFDVITKGGASKFIVRGGRTPEEGWLDPFALTPWIILTTIMEIEDHATVVDKTMADGRTRRRFQQFNKRNKMRRHPMLPPPFYTVYLRDKLIREQMRKAVPMGPGRKHTYRHDVEGHFRLYYKKYPLPTEESEFKRYKSLLKRGYRIFEYGQTIPADLYDMMMKRGRQPPSQGQYVALKKVRIDDHLSPNDPSLPYIPSVRKTTKGITSDKGRERIVPHVPPDGESDEPS